MEVEWSLKERACWDLECNCYVTPKNTPRVPLRLQQQRLQLATPSEEPPPAHPRTHPLSQTQERWCTKELRVGLIGLSRS